MASLQLLLLSSAVLTALLKFKPIDSACSPSSGPGGTDCIVWWEEYKQFQWATCLSSQVVADISAYDMQQWTCGTDPYCYLGCMEWAHASHTGPVSGDCECHPGQTIPVKSKIDDSCYTPSGSDCNFYKQCVEVAYPCTIFGQDDYATEFGQKFCSLCDQYSKNFTTKGANWITAMQKCLQKSLLTEIYPWTNRTCPQIKQFAYNSYPLCYSQPDKANSVCDVSKSDWEKIFWTFKSTFSQSYTSNLKSMLLTSYQCHGSWIHDVTDGEKHMLIEVELTNKSVSEIVEKDILAGQLIDSIVAQLHWADSAIIEWFSYAGYDPHNGNFGIHLLVADPSVLMLGYTESGEYPKKSFNDTFYGFLELAQNEGVDAKLEFLPNITVTGSMKSIGICSDASCNVIVKSIVCKKIDPPPFKKGIIHSANLIILLIGCVVAYTFYN